MRTFLEGRGEPALQRRFPQSYFFDRSSVLLISEDRLHEAVAVSTIALQITRTPEK